MTGVPVLQASQLHVSPLQPPDSVVMIEDSVVMMEASTELDSDSQPDPTGRSCASTELDDDLSSSQSPEDVDVAPTQFDSATMDSLGYDNGCEEPGVDYQSNCSAGQSMNGQSSHPQAVNGEVSDMVSNGVASSHPCPDMHAGGAGRSAAFNELLQEARNAGISFCRAFQFVADGAWVAAVGARTLAEEISDFERELAAGVLLRDVWPHWCRPPPFSAEEGTCAACDVWASFGGPLGYASFLQHQVDLPGAGVALNGIAAWQRLLRELDVSLRLTSAAWDDPPVMRGPMMLTNLQQCRPEESAQELMVSLAFPPLQRRIHYVSLRVAWGLRQLKASASECMFALGTDQRHTQSPILMKHATLLKSHPFLRSLVFDAIDAAIAASVGHFLKCLEAEATAGCQHPFMLLRASTQQSLDLSVRVPACPSQHHEGLDRAGHKARDCVLARQRVREEMMRRHRPLECSAGGLDERQKLPAALLQAFAQLRSFLAPRAAASAGVALTELCRWRLDEAMEAIALAAKPCYACEAFHA